MYTMLDTMPCKEYEQVDFAVVDCPDDVYTEQLLDIWGHKGVHWLWHIKEAASGAFGELETRTYIASIKGYIIGTVMNVVYKDTAVAIHGYVRPEYRQHGIYTKLWGIMLHDWVKRGGGIILGGIEYNGIAYRIYYKYGFRVLGNRSEFMRFMSRHDFYAEHFKIGDVTVVKPEWKHWPMWSALESVIEMETIRSVGLRVYGVANFEGYLHYRRWWNNPYYSALLLESEYGSVVGCLTLCDITIQTPTILDMFIHPNFADKYDVLLNAVDFPKGTTICYVGVDSPPSKSEALERTGFTCEGFYEGCLGDIHYKNLELLDAVKYVKVV